MLDKLKFNNLVISNAKQIQKIRIQTVRKIIQRMRKLKTQLDKQPDHESNIVKLRKCVAIVERVKKIKREDIIRNILLLEKNPNKIVTNSHSTPEEVAIAMIATNKNMQALTERFRQELNYNDEEAESWKKTLIEIGKQKAKKQLKKKRAEQNSAGSKKKSKSKDTKESSEESDDSDNEESDSSTEETIKIPNKSKKEKNEVVQENSSRVMKTKKSEINQKSIVDDSIESNEENSPSPVESPKKINKENKPSTIDPFAESNTTTKAKNPDIRNNDSVDFLMKDKIEEQKPRQEKKDKSKDETELKSYSCYKRPGGDDFQKNVNRKPVKVGVIDPFFRTITGDPFIANIEVRGDMEILNDSSEPPNDFNRKHKTTRFDKPADNHKPKKFRNDNVHDKSSEKSLHPSWVAKQKQRSISAFQGKKIVFDETISVEQTKISKTNRNSTIKEDLHPSWAAKQKLKPTITAFQGKKITFGDDE